MTNRATDFADKAVKKVGMTVGEVVVGAAISSAASAALFSDEKEHAEANTNDDEVLDAVEIESDDDDLVDVVAIDSNDDGLLDAIAADDDGDGLADAVALDVDYDGVVDIIAFEEESVDDEFGDGDEPASED